MKIIKQSLSTIAAVMIGIALAGPAQAQTVVDPATPNATPPGMNAYNDAMKTVKSDYQTAYANCKTMSGADRRNS